MSYYQELAEVVGGTSPQTEEQARAYLELFQNNTKSELCSRFKIHSRTTQKWRLKAEKILGKKSFEALPEGQQLKGVTVRYNGDGTVNHTYVKTEKDKNNSREFLKAFSDGLKQEIKPVEFTQPPEVTSGQLLTLYPISDYHLGIMGDGDSLRAQEILLENFMDYMIRTSPSSDTGVLCLLGDFLHFNSVTPVTPKAKHVLDVNCTFKDMIKSSMKLIRICIKKMLYKHKNVQVEIVRGNHDPETSIMLREFFATLYENEPRVTVGDPDGHYHAFKWGNTGLFFSHGDLAKMSQLPEVFVATYKQIYGSCRYHYAHCGHLHHQKQETRLMIIEQHPTLAKPSSYEKLNGYISNRAQHAIVYHKEFGEVSRNTATPEMLI